MITTTVPDRTEAADYYFTYIDRVPDGDICTLLDAQLPEVRQLTDGISEAQSLHRYAPDKWSIRDVMNHLIDCERLFIARAFWFARGLGLAQPSLRGVRRPNRFSIAWVGTSSTSPCFSSPK